MRKRRTFRSGNRARCRRYLDTPGRRSAGVARSMVGLSGLRTKCSGVEGVEERVWADSETVSVRGPSIDSKCDRGFCCWFPMAK